MRWWQSILMSALVLSVTWGSFKVASGYYEGTSGKEHRERLQRHTKCNELRAEFFGECRKAATRQQCEALYGQTRGHLFDGPPEMPFAKELDCAGITHED